MLFVTVALVCSVTGEETKDQKENPAFEAELTVGFSKGDFLPETALSLAEDLRETANLEDFVLKLDMTKDALSGSVRARFAFESLSELAAWNESESVKTLLLSLEQISGAPAKLEIRGRLAS
jgi:hypothetical protein